MMSSSQKRLQVLRSHICPNIVAENVPTVGDSQKKYTEVIDHKPQLRTKLDYINK